MVDIIIVNWNSGDFLRACVGSIFQSESTELINSIIIIDNDSTDESLSEIYSDKNIVIIRNKENKGFSKGCNQGFDLCKNSYALLLNPDCQLNPKTIRSCVNFMEENTGVDIMGCNLLDDHGHTTVSCSRFPTPLRFFFDSTGLSKVAPSIFPPATLMTDWNHMESRYVDQVMGAFMVIRRNVFERIGYFDERFFVYFEELDFSKRLASAGGKSFYNHEITAIHSGKGTTEAVKGFRLFLLLNSRLAYAKKHFTYPGYLFVKFSSIAIEPITRITFLLFKWKIADVREVIKAYKLFFRSRRL